MFGNGRQIRLVAQIFRTSLFGVFKYEKPVRGAVLSAFYGWTVASWLEVDEEF